jgi:hypothetical protein
VDNLLAVHCDDTTRLTGNVFGATAEFLWLRSLPKGISPSVGLIYACYTLKLYARR